MTARPDQAAIIGVGSSEIVRASDRSISAFALDAAVAALSDAGLTADQIDGYIGAPSATSGDAIHSEGADEISQRLLAQSLGLKNLRWSADLFWDFLPSVLVAASHALAAGACRNVLVVRAMHSLKGPSWPPRRNSTLEASGEAQFETPFGYRTGGARFAMRARQYMEASGMTRRDLYNVIAHSRRHAALNPLAIWRHTPVSLDAYLAAPMIAEPLGLLDCDMPVCGAAAFVITRADAVRDAPHPPVYLAGWSQWQRPEAIFEASGRTRDDVQLAQIYDGFSTMAPEWLERLGWRPLNSGWRAFTDGSSDLGGRLPLNTFGGSLGEGRLHGAGHVREAVLQLSGRAHGRQVAGAENCLVQVGPHDFASLVMLSNAPG